jgi:ABC-type uncharacterized transport system substrate-binding protein
MPASKNAFGTTISSSYFTAIYAANKAAQFSTIVITKYPAKYSTIKPAIT